LNDVFYTSLALLLFVGFYTAIFFFLKKQDWSTDKKHKLAVSIRNSLFFAFLIVVAFVWSGELKTFIFSFAAIFSAFVLVFKELILGMVGYIITNKVFSIGDYIEYDGIQGKIIDKTFLNTRVLITEPYLNKEMVFPNMHYITHKVINLSKFGKFQIYRMVFSSENISEIYDLSNSVLSIVNNAIAPHKEKYLNYYKEMNQENFLFEIPTVEPKITYDFSDVKKVSFTVYYMSHPLDKDSIENTIIQDYLKLNKNKEVKSNEIEN
jgi:hypothetical protein